MAPSPNFYYFVAFAVARTLLEIGASRSVIPRYSVAAIMSAVASAVLYDNIT